MGPAGSRRRWLAARGPALGALLAALLAGCATLVEPEQPPARGDSPEQVFLDARVELQEGALVRGAIRARRMEQIRRRSLMRMIDSVEVVSWDSLGRVESLTLCDTLLYRRDRQDLSAEGRVRVLAASDPQGKRLESQAQGTDLATLRRDPPFQLRTTRLDYLQRIEKIKTEAPVVFYTPYDTLRGVGFLSDRNLRNWEINAPVGVTHRVRESGTDAKPTARPDLSRPATAPPGRPPLRTPATTIRPVPKKTEPARKPTTPPRPNPAPTSPWPVPGGGG